MYIIATLNKSELTIFSFVLIGLFALIIYRTMEPKKLQGGRERAFVNTCFLMPATAGTGILGVVFAWLATAGTGTNGLKAEKYIGLKLCMKGTSVHI